MKVEEEGVRGNEEGEGKECWWCICIHTHIYRPLIWKLSESILGTQDNFRHVVHYENWKKSFQLRIFFEINLSS